MNRTYQIAQGIIISVAFIAFVCWILVRWLKHSKDDPVVLIIKWIVTIPLVGIIFFSIFGLGVMGPIVIVFCAVILSILWAPNIATSLAKPITNAIDGGSEPPVPQPYYSIPRALRGKGKYLEAVAEIRKQLAKFPNDLEGHLLLSEIQAENLNDLPGAEITIQRWCSQPGHAPRNIAFALNTLADWHLKFAQDRDAARLALEQIIGLLPKSEFSALASQRIAHLAETKHLLSPHDRQRFKVTPGIEDIGLLDASQHPKPAGMNPAELAVEYVKHLEQHPLDTEAREKLAVIYADHYQRLDLAAGELEQLISQPEQPAKRVIHWLDSLADLQIKHSAGYETVRQTLQRIIDLSPDSAAAHTALRRMDHLKLELKANEKSQAVKLGSYEQDIGLKRGSPH